MPTQMRDSALDRTIKSDLGRELKNKMPTMKRFLPLPSIPHARARRIRLTTPFLKTATTTRVHHVSSSPRLLISIPPSLTLTSATFPTHVFKLMKTSAILHSLPTSLETSLTKITRLLLGTALVSLLPSCGDSPKTCFDRAVLNCNMIHDFAGRGMEMFLESPSVKLTGKNPGETAPMTRKEMVDDKITFVEQSLVKVRQLRQTDDNRDIVLASIALHEYVLPVYRDDYQRLAKLYDDGAPPAEIAQLAAAIATKHGPPFQALSDRLTTAGKAYATRHGIKVMWDVRTSPSP